MVGGSPSATPAAAVAASGPPRQRQNQHAGIAPQPAARSRAAERGDTRTGQTVAREKGRATDDAASAGPARRGVHFAEPGAAAAVGGGATAAAASAVMGAAAVGHPPAAEQQGEGHRGGCEALTPSPAAKPGAETPDRQTPAGAAQAATAGGRKGTDATGEAATSGDHAPASDQHSSGGPEQQTLGGSRKGARRLRQ